MIDIDKLALVLGVKRSTLPDFNTLDSEAGDVGPCRTVEPMSDDEWAIVSEHLPRLPVPKPQVDYQDRQFINAALWYVAVRETGKGWGHMPPHLGSQSSRSHRWYRWALLGYWSQVALALKEDGRLNEGRRAAFDRLAVEAERRRRRKNEAASR